MKKLMLPILLLVFGYANAQIHTSKPNYKIDTCNVMPYISIWGIENTYTKRTDVRFQNNYSYADFNFDKVKKDSIVQVKVIGDTVQVLRIMCTLYMQQQERFTAAKEVLDHLDLENISKLKNVNRELYDAIIKYKKIQ